MDGFKAQVAAGTASIQSASFCLQTEYSNCLASPVESLSASLATSGAGTCVLDWVWAADKGQEILRHPKIVTILMDFLVAERQHHAVMQWVQRSLHYRWSSTPAEPSKRHANLLMDLIRSEASAGQGLRSATACYVSAVHAATQAGVDLTQPGKAAAKSIRNVALYLIQELSKLEKSEELQKTTLDPLVQAVKGFSQPGSYTRAVLDLQVAGNPSPDLALLYFSNLKNTILARASSQQMTHMTSTGLRTAELCLALDRKADAMHMLSFLQNNFGKELRTNTSRIDERVPWSRIAKEEQQSLHLLDSLVVA